MCSSIWNSKLSLPLFCTFSIVCRPSLPSVTLYTRPKSYGHAFFASSLSSDDDKPKSSLTPSSPPEASLPDSEEDLPRYSHVELRAKPC